MKINFQNFLGNDDVKKAITVAFSQDRLPQAIILQGDKGVGKRTFAKIIANIAVCSSENKACGTCPACIRAKAGSHPDIRIEEGSGVSGNISVESIRDIIEDAYRKPDEADYNIFLLFVKNTLLPSSQNKLLKIMEEPPGKALFIIAINSAETLLPTIRSRAVTYRLSAPSIDESANFIAEKNELNFDEALKVSQMYAGNIGAMLEGNVLSVEIANKFLKIFDSNDEDALLAILAPLIKNKDDFRAFLEKLREEFRDALVESFGVKNKIAVNAEQTRRIARIYRKESLIKLPQICTEYIDLIGKNINMSLVVTSFCASVRSAILK